jgi:hypothetical protein
MIERILCLINIHKWEGLWRPSRCSYYPFDILVHKKCTRCGKIIIPEEK